VNRDRAVEAILDAIRRENMPTYERHAAVIRAGAIAQTYIGANEELLESVFGSASELMLQNHCNDDDATGISGR